MTSEQPKGVVFTRANMAVLAVLAVGFLVITGLGSAWAYNQGRTSGINDQFSLDKKLLPQSTATVTLSPCPPGYHAQQGTVFCAVDRPTRTSLNVSVVITLANRTVDVHRLLDQYANLTRAGQVPQLPTTSTSSNPGEAALEFRVNLSNVTILLPTPNPYHLSSVYVPRGSSYAIVDLVMINPGSILVRVTFTGTLVLWPGVDLNLVDATYSSAQATG